MMPIRETPQGGKLVIFDMDGTLTPHRPSSTTPFERRLCAGVAERIRELRGMGYQLAVATNQGGVKRGFPIEQVEAQLAWVRETLGITVWRYAVEEEDKKPNPRMLLELLAEFGIFPADAVMVGDCASDRLAAEAAGIAFLHVRDFIEAGIG